MQDLEKVLILTPVKDAKAHLPDYFERLLALSYPKAQTCVALLEGDSADGTFEALSKQADTHRQSFCSLEIFKHDYGYHIPAGLPRWASAVQKARRQILARSRNQLLFRALRDHDWVLWLDVDVIDYPSNLLETLISHDLPILHPDCVTTPGGESFDKNAWKDGGQKHMHDLRGTGQAVRIDSVGGTVLLIRGDCHRDGLIFPPYPYGVECPAIRTKHPVWGRGEIETEGLAMMARDMGLQCWGLPDLQVVHAPQ